MNRRRLLVSLAAGLACCASTVAHAELLFTKPLLIDRSANIFKTDEFNLKVDFSSTFTSPVLNTLFNDLVISPTSAGQVFDVEPGDSGFDDVSALLTDSLNQAMRFVMTEKSSGRAEGRGYTQAQLFAKPPAAPDFSGKIIDKVELTVDQFTLVAPPPAGVQALSSGKPVELRFTFNVFGHSASVPEPSTLALEGGALALAAARRRRALARKR